MPRPPRAVLLASAISLVGLLSCVEGTAPTDPDMAAPRASLVVLPVFPSAPQRVEGETAAPVTLIRLTVLRTPGNEQVARTETTVDPAATEWEVTADVPLTGDPGDQYVIEVELINNSGGVESVEWSGRAGPLDLGAGTTSPVREVGVSRGPLDNLSVISLAVDGPTEVPEQSAFSLTADVGTSDAGAHPVVYWTSLDPEVATIAQNGKGQALAAGTARIQAQSGPLTVVHRIQVLSTPDAVIVAPAEVQLTDVGQIAEFSATVRGRAGETIPDAAVTWSVGDPRVVESMGDGRFQAIAAGSTTVTATSVDDPGLADSGLIVVAATPASMSIDPADATLASVGQTVSLTTRVLTAGGTRVFGVPTTWSSSDPSVATVGPDGVVTAVSEGEVTITAQTDPVGDPPAPLVATATVRVAFGVSTVQVKPASATLTQVGQQQAMQAVALDASGATIPNPTVGWSTSDASVVTVSPGGVIEAVSDGTATIGASVAGVTGTATVTVDIAVASVVVTPSTATLDVAAQTTLSAEAVDPGGAAFSTTFVWSSSDETVATVSSGGVVTGVGAGTAEIAATAKGVSGSATVTVQAASVPQPGSYSTEGNTQLVTASCPIPSTAHVYDPNGLLATTPGLTITSTGSQPTIAGGSVDVNANGCFSYLPPAGFQGTDQFTYTVDTGASATVQIDVSGMVWYVGYGGDGDGTSLNYYPGAGGPIGQPGDVIYVYDGGGNPISGGFTLQAGQQLIGEGTGLTIDPFGQLHPAGPTPQISSSGAGVTLADETFVSGLALVGTDDGIVASGAVTANVVDVLVQNSNNDGVALNNVTGTLTFDNLIIDGAANDGFSVSGGSPTATVNLGGPVGIQGATGQVVRITGTQGGQVTFNGGEISSTNGEGVEIGSAAGNVAFNSSVIVGNPTSTPGIAVSGTAGDVVFGSAQLTTTGWTGIRLFNNTGKVSVLAGTVNTTNQTGLDIDSAPTDLTLNSLVVNSSDPDYSLVVIGNSPGSLVSVGTLTLASAGGGTPLVLNSMGNFSAAGGSISATTGPAVSVIGSGVDVDLASVSSTTTFGNAIWIQASSGTFSATGGTLTTSGTSAVNLDSNTALDFTYGGTISNTGGNSVLAANNSGAGSVFLFSGDITDSSQGIQLTANSGVTTEFSGNLDINPYTSAALLATGGNTIQVLGGSNTLSSSLTNGVSLTDLVGDSYIQNASISSAQGAGFRVQQTKGSGTLTVVGSDISNSSTGGMSVVASASGILDLTITNSTLSNNGQAPGLSVGATGTSQVAIR